MNLFLFAQAGQLGAILAFQIVQKEAGTLVTRSSLWALSTESPCSPLQKAIQVLDTGIQARSEIPLRHAPYWL